MPPNTFTFTPESAGNAEFLDAFGPLIRIITPLSEVADGYCLIESIFPAGVVVPMHSHADRETFYVLAGEIQGFRDGVWRMLGPGEVFDVPENVSHAWRNVSSTNVSLLFVTTMKMGRFLRQISRPLSSVQPGPPNPEELQRFLKTAQCYGYWLGSPEDNAAADIRM
jgi:mannose-6-phosphate isomerase-like protein (cupin superfamily)